MALPLPVNIDSTYADDAGDASVQVHQSHHDDIHAVVNVVGAGRVEAVEETTTARTLALSDAGKVVEATNASATTITVPPNSSVAFAVGTVVGVYAAGAGGVTIAAGAGVTIRNLAAVAQYGEVSLRKRATDEWVQA